MKGYKTVTTGAVSIIAGLATLAGVTIDPETLQQLQDNVDIVIGGGMATYGLIMIILRKFTSSPMFNKGKDE